MVPLLLLAAGGPGSPGSPDAATDDDPMELVSADAWVRGAEALGVNVRQRDTIEAVASLGEPAVKRARHAARMTKRPWEVHPSGLGVARCAFDSAAWGSQSVCGGFVGGGPSGGGGGGALRFFGGGLAAPGSVRCGWLQGSLEYSTELHYEGWQDRDCNCDL